MSFAPELYQKQNVLFRTGLTQGDSLLYFLRDESGFDLIDSPAQQLILRRVGVVTRFERNKASMILAETKYHSRKMAVKTSFI